MNPERRLSEAGRELDAEIAERVMGLPRLAIGQMEPLGGFFDYGEDFRGICVRRETARGDWTISEFHPSADISAAMQVVEKWRARGEGFQLDSLGFRGEQGMPDAEWRCVFMDASNGGMELYDADAVTAPLAICLAALAAVDSRSTTSLETK